jgi:drug/metabolite transporter (DMT)-like permease
MTTPPSSMALVLAASFIGSFGAVFLKAGANRLHRNPVTLLVNWRLAMGVVFFMGSSLLYLKGIKHGELTVLYPMVSLGYVWTLLWSRLFFGEPFTRGKFAGLGMILAGIFALAFGNR